MRVFVQLVFAICICWPCYFSSAQPATSSQENRFLFVIESSFAARPAARAMRETVLDLIETGFNGAMKEGDTYGIWCYNQTLNTSFSVQRWSPYNTNKTAASLNFINQIRFEKTANLSLALKPVLPILTASQNITLVLLSDGKESLNGTPFDPEINALFRQYYVELKRAKIPFVTVLSAANGTIWGYAVNSSIGPIQLPARREPTAPPAIQPIESQLDPTRSTSAVKPPAATKTVTVPATNGPIAGPAALSEFSEPQSSTLQTNKASTNAVAQSAATQHSSSGEPERKKTDLVEILEQRARPSIQIIIPPQLPKETIQVPSVLISTNPEEYEARVAPKTVQPQTNEPLMAESSPTPKPVQPDRDPAVAAVPVTNSPSVTKPVSTDGPSLAVAATSLPVQKGSALRYLFGGILLLGTSLGLLWFLKKGGPPKKNSSIISQSIDRHK